MIWIKCMLEFHACMCMLIYMYVVLHVYICVLYVCIPEFCAYIESMLKFYACMLYLLYILSLKTFLYRFGSILLTFSD